MQFFGNRYHTTDWPSVNGMGFFSAKRLKILYIRSLVGKVYAAFKPEIGYRGAALIRFWETACVQAVATKHFLSEDYIRFAFPRPAVGFQRGFPFGTADV